MFYWEIIADQIANAFLTLYSRNFIRGLPGYAEFVVIIIGLMLAAAIVSIYGGKRAILLIAVEILAFFALSFVLMALGYIWGYALFPILVIICPALASAGRGGRRKIGTVPKAAISR